MKCPGVIILSHMNFERMEDTKTELVVTVFPSRSHVTPPSYEFQVLLG
jgi:hypothetical protein